MDHQEFYNGSLKTATIKGASDPSEHLRQLVNQLLGRDANSPQAWYLPSRLLPKAENDASNTLSSPL
jgi:hypothetical protein